MKSKHNDDKVEIKKGKKTRLAAHSSEENDEQTSNSKRRKKDSSEKDEVSSATSSSEDDEATAKAAIQLPPPGKTSKYLGVDYNKHAKKYEARFMYQRRIYHLGLFTTEVDAAKAYDEAVFINRGPDAPRNFSYKGIPPSRHSSVFRGVNFDKRSKKWKASMRIDGKSAYFGLFMSEIDAAKEYDKQALKYQGLKARLNFPDDPEAKKALETLRRQALEEMESSPSSVPIDDSSKTTLKKSRRQAKTDAEHDLEADE